MVAAVNALKLDGLQPRLVEQVPGQLAAGSRKLRLFRRVLLHHPFDPELWTKNQTDQQAHSENGKNKHRVRPGLIPQQRRFQNIQSLVQHRVRCRQRREQPHRIGVNSAGQDQQPAL
jgi:hypothetical protein